MSEKNTVEATDKNTPDYSKEPPPRSHAMKLCGFIGKMAFLYLKMGITLWFLTKLPFRIDV